jgi:hypothetical protein
VKSVLIRIEELRQLADIEKLVLRDMETEMRLGGGYESAFEKLMEQSRN